MVHRKPARLARTRAVLRPIGRHLTGRGPLLAEVAIVAASLAAGVAGVWVLTASVGWGLVAMLPAGLALAYMVGPGKPTTPGR